MDITILNEFHEHFQIYYSVEDEDVYTDITKNRTKYAQKNGYTFLDTGTSIDDGVHWNWKSWLGIKKVIDLIESGITTDWIWHGDAKILISNYDLTLESLISTHISGQQEIIIPYYIPRVGANNTHVWYNDLRGDLTVKSSYVGNFHNVISPNFLLVKNSSNALNFLKTVYDDGRFILDQFSEDYCKRKFKNDDTSYYYYHGEHIPSHAFTIYYEGYPEYRHLLSIILANDFIVGLTNDADEESWIRDTVKNFKNKGTTYQVGDHFAGIVCVSNRPKEKIKEIADQGDDEQ